MRFFKRTSKRMTLASFPHMPQSLRSRLQSHGIATPGDLLQATAWPADREKNLARLGLDVNELRPWIVASDLSRVTSPDQTWLAELLALSGIVHSAQDLSKKNDSQIREALRLYADEEPRLEELSSSEMLKQLVGHARLTPPRVVWNYLGPDDIYDVSRAKQHRDAQITRRLLRVTVFIVACLFVIFDLSLKASSDRELARWVSQLEGVPEQTALVFGTAGRKEADNALLYGSLAFQGLSLIGLWLWLEIGIRAASRLDPELKVRLASSSVAKELFLTIGASAEYRLAERAGAVSLVPFLLIAIGLVMYPPSVGNMSPAAAPPLFPWIVHVSAITAAAFVIVGDWRGLRDYARTWSFAHRLAYNRYLIYRLLSLLFAIIYIAGGTVLIVRIAMETNSLIQRQVILPTYYHRLQLRRSEILAILSTMESEYYMYERIQYMGIQHEGIQALDRVEFALTYPQERIVPLLAGMNDFILDPRIIQGVIVFWWEMVAIFTTAAFLVPFLLPINRRRLVVFLGLALATYGVEALLTDRLYQFSRPLLPGVTLAVLVLFGVMFAAAVAATLEDELRGPDSVPGPARRCSRCGEYLPERARYCSTCGVLQEG